MTSRLYPQGEAFPAAVPANKIVGLVRQLKEKSAQAEVGVRTKRRFCNNIRNFQRERKEFQARADARETKLLARAIEYQKQIIALKKKLREKDKYIQELINLVSK